MKKKYSYKSLRRKGKILVRYANKISKKKYSLKTQARMFAKKAKSLEKK